ncbi:MAG TPA: beta-propeller domain-containing protein [Polyangiaceae bacterium]|nr:beta-propeller domain-containing protein [Polyangiaceae bacterium]
MRKTFLLRVVVLAALVAGFGVQACSGGNSSSPEENGPSSDIFESDSPSFDETGGSDRGGVDAGSGGGGGTGGSGGTTAAPESGDDPNRAIAEADIVQRQGDRLYALSRSGGLSVIDAANPRALQVLGRYRTQFTPFEMYLRGSVVLALYNDWGSYERVGADWNWVQTSQVLALDVSNPAAIQKLGTFRIVGKISDSRIVGDVLYVVSYENGYCYECATQPRTTVLSLNVGNPSAVRKVEALSFDSKQGQWGGGERSINVTESRIYVAGPEYDGAGTLGSTIQVIDISDPAGDLVLGAGVRVDGQIQSRWQMDEYAGVLRVISQPWQWSLDVPPTVQTFRIQSSQSLQPLGRVALQLPRPEQLQSTRFDGPRAYAITFQRTDPLFTIDLSNPAAPKQAGELEMPGWVYHMEPRGDRLLGLGFDQQNASGSLHVSIFDVSDLSAPHLIDRVNFGSGWASVSEDQDRIHKSFQVLDDQGLILVPFSGYGNSTDGYYCGGSYQSGVQLVDFTRDDLVLRGMASSYGQARRAFLHREALFTVSDDRVQTFDIANRDRPAVLHTVPLARQVQSAAVVGQNLVRLGSDWWSNGAQLDVAPMSAADQPGASGSLDLKSVIEHACGSGLSQARVFGHGQYAYVLYEDYNYQDYGQSSSGPSQTTALAVVDVSDPTKPKLVTNKVLGVSASYGWYGWGTDNVVPSGEQVLQFGSTLVLARAPHSYYYSRETAAEQSAVLDIVDVADPADIQLTSLELPTGGNTGLHREGNAVLTSHYEHSSEGRVRFYVDRVDISNPRAPRFTSKVNVPGSLLAWDAASRRAITVDYRRHVRENAVAQDCYGAGGYWVSGTSGSTYVGISTVGKCTVFEQIIKQVRVADGRATLEGSWAVPERLSIAKAGVGDDRVFVGFNRVTYYYYDEQGRCAGDCEQESSVPVLVLSPLASGALQARSIDLPVRQAYSGYVSQLVAFGTRALVQVGYQDGLTILETAGAEPKIAGEVDVLGSLVNVQKHDNLAILSLGYHGVRIVDVSR